RLRLQAERDAARDEARRLKEEERARREAEREAYRKAKEVERERLRAEREAARRALEGRVARATRRAQRVAGVGRSSTTRVYRPDAIPNQSGTTRRLGDGEPQQQNRFANLRAPEPSSPANAAPDALADADHRPPLSPAPAASPPPPPEPSIPDRFDERYALIEARLANADESFRKAYDDNFDMSWIHHDSALEGVVYTFLELKTAIDPAVSVVADSSLQPVCAEIRRHKAAIQLVRELGEKKRVPLGVDVIKKIFLVLHPEEGDLKSVKYRKDIPQHRLYFHEYAAPDKIAYKVRQVVDWLNGPEPKKVKNPVRIAARVHYDLLRVFPFAVDSGKVARLLMNVLLLRAGYPPAIIHSTERQRYYEALKGSLPTIVSMMNEAIGNGLASVEKLLDEHGIRAPSEPPPIG
ncbi:MAG: Fic family protein, partial [Sorangiineae bacterium]|nr:Fic family protein [Sorangiineae bacterium]